LRIGHAGNHILGQKLVENLIPCETNGMKSLILSPFRLELIPSMMMMSSRWIGYPHPPHPDA